MSQNTSIGSMLEAFKSEQFGLRMGAVRDSVARFVDDMNYTLEFSDVYADSRSDIFGYVRHHATILRLILDKEAQDVRTLSWQYGFFANSRIRQEQLSIPIQDSIRKESMVITKCCRQSILKNSNYGSSKVSTFIGAIQINIESVLADY